VYPHYTYEHVYPHYTYEHVYLYYTYAHAYPHSDPESTPQCVFKKKERERKSERERVTQIDR